MHLVRHGIDLAKPADDNILRGGGLVVVIMRKHLAASIKKKQSEQSQHLLEAFDHRSTGKNKNTAQDESAKDAPEEHLMLSLATEHFQIGHKHQQHQNINIIHAHKGNPIKSILFYFPNLACTTLTT